MEKIAIKELAYFVHQSGDLTTEFFSNYDLEIGKKAHSYLQSQYQENDEKEYYIKQEVSLNGESYLLHGFIDGVLNISDVIVIEEIKSTTQELETISSDFHKEHLAQAKIYAYLYAISHDMDMINIRLTYVSVVDYDVKSFDFVFNTSDLETFTFETLESYITWLKTLDDANTKRCETIESIKFPFETERPGQKDLMKATYKALRDNEILYAIAPTGIGKTMATLFSALKVLKKNDKLFYLTAKGSGKNAPLEAMRILQDKGLKIKVIDITAKKKMCNARVSHCNPDECPYAKGYFDKLRKATEDIFNDYDIFSSEVILEASNTHEICAFEFSLYLSYFCDLIIADYNYAFDPKAQLIRYFEDDTYKPKLLIDEAHNLISRSKDMYSASINEDDIRIIRSKLNGFTPSVRQFCNKAIEILESYNDKMVDGTVFIDSKMNSDLNVILRNIYQKCEQIFEENKKIKDKDIIYDAFFKIMDFIRISEYFGENHRLIAKLENGKVIVGYYCLNASEYLLDTIENKCHGVVFFSATLYPIDYHVNLLTKGVGKYINLPSPFDPNNLDIIIDYEISTKFKNRENTVDRILETIDTLTSAHEGNYIVFFPSYAYLNMIVSAIKNPNYEMIIQTNDLTDFERDSIITKFKTTTNTKVGFFVMGGNFSEGIDYVGNALSGVIIVGVGLPLICDENNLLKEYFDDLYQKGFDYAYTYPGFTKVIQAVGRVIRTYSDTGVAILMDERFSYNLYKNLFPAHWSNIKMINTNYKLKRELLDFYKKH